jgi:hypothetical protein
MMGAAWLNDGCGVPRLNGKHTGLFHGRPGSDSRLALHPPWSHRKKIYYPEQDIYPALEDTQQMKNFTRSNIAIYCTVTKVHQYLNKNVPIT